MARITHDTIDENGENVEMITFDVCQPCLHGAIDSLMEQDSDLDEDSFYTDDGGRPLGLDEHPPYDEEPNEEHRPTCDLCDKTLTARD